MSISAKRPFLLFLSLLIFGIVGVAAGGFLLAQPEYTVFDGEQPFVVSGNFATVAEVLAAAGVNPRPEDGLSHLLAAPADPNSPIVVSRARPVTVQSNGGSTTYWTTAPTLAAFLHEASIGLRPTDLLKADGQPVLHHLTSEQPLPQVVEIGRFNTVTIIDGGQQQTLRTSAQTVGQAIEEAGIALFAADGTEPPLGSWLEPEMEIRVRRSMPLSIQVDGRTLQTRSHHTTALAVVAEAGVSLVGADYVLPANDVQLQPNDTVTVVRVTETFQLEDEPIPFQTLFQADANLALDSRQQVSGGQPGVLRRRWRIRVENGVPQEAVLDGEWVAQEAVNEVIAYGTKITINTLDTPQGPLAYWRVVRMRVTAYTAASSGKPPDHPAYGITASGRPAGYGIVAIDRAVVPFRSNVYVPGYGVGFAGDTGGGVRGRWIDLGYDEENYQSWSGYVDVYYLTPVPAADDINYLLPQNLP